MTLPGDRGRRTSADRLGQNLPVSSDPSDNGGDEAGALWQRLQGLGGSPTPPAGPTDETGSAEPLAGAERPEDDSTDTPPGAAAHPAGDSTPAPPDATESPDGAGSTPLAPGSFRVGAPLVSQPAAAPRPLPGVRPDGGHPVAPVHSTAPERPSPAAAPRPAAPDRGGRSWYRPRLRWLTVYVPIAIVVLLVGGAIYGWNAFRSVGRVDLEGTLEPAGVNGQNILIVGSDTRDVVAADTPNAAAMGSEGVAGERSDTLIVLRLEGDRASMMSIPRDLWVTNAETGSDGRINAAFNAGPANLVRTVSDNLGIPINRYLEVDFVSFAGIVDALGGIEITFAHPAYDRGSGLLVGAGPQLLDGTQALAYVRSRHYTEIIDGRDVVDPTGDIGRQQRQQSFIRAVLGTAGTARNPLTLLRVGNAAASGARIDDEWGFFDAVGIVRRMAGTDPETFVLPTVPARRGSAAVLLLDEPAAEPVLTRFGADAS